MPDAAPTRRLAKAYTQVPRDATTKSPAPTPAGTPLQFTYDPSTFFVQPAPGAPLYIALINMVTNITYTEVTSCGTNCAQIPVPVGAVGAAFAVLTMFSSADDLNENQLSAFGSLTGPAEVILS